MSLESSPTSGKNAIDYFDKLIANPESISSGMKQREEFIVISGKDIPRTVFYKFVGDIATGLRTRLSSTICLDNSALFQMQTHIINLAEEKAEESFDGNGTEIKPRDLALIIGTIANDTRVQCEDCFTSPSECKLRRPNAPIDEVYKKAGRGLIDLQIR